MNVTTCICFTVDLSLISSYFIPISFFCFKLPVGWIFLNYTNFYTWIYQDLLERIVCPICDNLLKRNDSSIDCDLCLLYKSFSKSDKQCIDKCLPFNLQSYNDNITDNIGINMTSDDITILTPESPTPFPDE